MSIESVEAFHTLVADIESKDGYRRPSSFGVGIATCAALDPEAASLEPGDVLDTWFPYVNVGENFGAAAALASVVGHVKGSASYVLNTSMLQQALALFGPFVGDGNRHSNIEALQTVLAGIQRFEAAKSDYDPARGNLADAMPKRAVITFIDSLEEAPVDAHEAYLRLHLISSRKVKPHGCNLDGVFGKLSNVAWTNAGPFAANTFEQTRSILRRQGHRVQVQSVDKFPRMTDYVVPTGVRIGDADRVRLGAYLGEGTTVMHEGFVNFNAGTLGTSMIEGRISAGVVVGNGSDVGGSASIMGTLSGGGKAVISLGKQCLLGANSGCGISLGDNCTIEAGCYVTAGSKVTMPDGKIVKASELSGKADMLFIRNSQTGAIQMRLKRNTTVLNDALHNN